VAAGIASRYPGRAALNRSHEHQIPRSARRWLAGLIRESFAVIRVRSEAEQDEAGHDWPRSFVSLTRLTADGRRLDRHGAGRIVRKVACRAGISKNVGPHTLRHAFITAALDAGVPLRDVQEAASHADPRTTMRYDRARTSLDRHATYFVATYVAGARGNPQGGSRKAAWPPSAARLP